MTSSVGVIVHNHLSYRLLVPLHHINYNVVVFQVRGFVETLPTLSNDPKCLSYWNCDIFTCKEVAKQ